MKNMTDHLLAEMSPELAGDWLELGAQHARNKQFPVSLKWARKLIAEMRALHGFKPVWASILTEPDANMKLAKGNTPAYGITLQHHVVKTLTSGTLNLCPNAGDCTKVCVLNNGSGAYPAVQRARRWKTELLAKHPWAFFMHLGYEIEKAVQKHDLGDEPAILVRPNVNSDIEWEHVCPALVDGTVFGSSVKLYGYTKMTAVLDGDGWITPHYRVAYSWNERSDTTRVPVAAFLKRGGSMAVVTDRKKSQPVRQWSGKRCSVIDADLTDEWIFQGGAIGDLSAKGKARRLIGKSGFVVSIYGNAAPRQRVTA